MLWLASKPFECHRFVQQHHTGTQSASRYLPVNPHRTLPSLGFGTLCANVYLGHWRRRRSAGNKQARRLLKIREQAKGGEIKGEQLNLGKLQVGEQHNLGKWWSRFAQVGYAVFCPLMSVGFLRLTVFLNEALSAQPLLETLALSTLGLFALSVLHTGFFPKSMRSIVDLIYDASLVLGLAPWRAEILLKFKKPLADIVQGLMYFLVSNILVNAIPEAWSWDVPPLLSFCDINGDGTLEAAEIEAAFYNVSCRIWGAYVVYQVLTFLQTTKSTLETPVPRKSGSPLAVYLRSLQELRAERRASTKLDTSNISSTWCLDKIVTTFLWLVAGLCWQRIAGIQMQTLLAVGGVGGLALSLAAKNITQNIISGFLIFFNRRLVEGEEIADSKGESLGVVNKIGLTTTVVHRLEGDKLILPNSHLVDNSIINVQRRNFWLVEEGFPLVLTSFINLNKVIIEMDEAVKEGFQEVCILGHQHDSVCEEPLVYFAGYGHQGAMIKVRAYFPGALARHEFYRARSNMLLKLNDIALSHQGAAIGLEAHFVGGGRADLPAAQQHDSH